MLESYRSKIKRRRSCQKILMADSPDGFFTMAAIVRGFSSCNVPPRWSMQRIGPQISRVVEGGNSTPRVPGRVGIGSPDLGLSETAGRRLLADNVQFVTPIVFSAMDREGAVVLVKVMRIPRFGRRMTIGRASIAWPGTNSNSYRLIRSLKIMRTCSIA